MSASLKVGEPAGVVPAAGSSADEVSALFATDRPKSATLASNSFVRRILSGFISRWTRPF